MSISLNKPTVGSTGWGSNVNNNFTLIEDALNGTSNSGSNVTIGPMYIGTGNWIGLGSSGGRIEFDSSSTDKLSFLNCLVGIGTNSPLTLGLHVKSTAASGDLVYIEGPSLASGYGLQIDISGNGSAALFAAYGSASWGPAVTIRQDGTGNCLSLSETASSTGDGGSALNISSSAKTAPAIKVNHTGGSNGPHINLANKITKTTHATGDLWRDQNNNLQYYDGVRTTLVNDPLGSPRLYWRSGKFMLDYVASDRGYPALDTGIDWTSNNDANYVYQLNAYPAPHLNLASGYCSASHSTAYGVYPSDFASTGVVKISFDSTGLGYWFTHGKSAYAPNDYFTGEFLVWNMGTPTYNSGWTAAAASTLYTKAHGISSGNYDNLLVVCEFCLNSDGSGDRLPTNGCVFDQTGNAIQCGVVKLDTTNVYIRTRANLVTYYDSGGTARTRTSGYYRVRIWQLTPDYDSGTSTSIAVTSLTQYNHKLGTDAFFAMPVISSGSAPSSSSWALYGANCDGGASLHICEMNDQFISTYNPTYHGLFMDSAGTNQAPTGTGYYRMLLWY